MVALRSRRVLSHLHERARRGQCFRLHADACRYAPFYSAAAGVQVTVQWKHGLSLREADVISVKLANFAGGPHAPMYPSELTGSSAQYLSAPVSAWTLIDKRINLALAAPIPAETSLDATVSSAVGITLPDSQAANSNRLTITSTSMRGGCAPVSPASLGACSRAWLGLSWPRSGASVVSHRSLLGLSLWQVVERRWSVR